jgi:flagellin
MALAIATNTGALMAAASATSVNKDMETSMERLSTGKRINSAADDAAGVAIASRLTSEIRGTNQAIRNAQDGQALINTAEGAHKEVENILQRMRELATQSANDTNSATDRTNLAAEMTQLTTEIDRIAAVTTWAGQSLLNGTGTTTSLATLHTSTADFSFQVGAGTSAKDSISVAIGALTAGALGIGGTAQTPVVTSTVTATGAAATVSETGGTVTVAGDFNNGDTFSLDVNGQTFTVTASNSDQFEDDATGIASQLATAVEDAIALADAATTPTAAQAALRGLTMTDNGDGTFDIAQASTTPITSTVTSGDATLDTSVANKVTIAGTAASGDNFTVTIAGVDVAYVAGTTVDGVSDTTAAGHAQGLASAINATTALKDAGYTATAASGVVTITRDALDIANESSTSSQGAATLTEASGTFTVGGSVDNGDIFSMTIDGTTVTATISTSDGYSDDVTGAASQIAQAIKDAGIEGLTVTDNLDGTFELERFGSVDITTAANAAAAIDAIDAAIQTVNSQRANLGAVSNRMDNTVNNLTNVVINLEGGRGRIEDADFAAESTSLAKSQILQQASTAMLAQANASKQSVLSLLQG